MSGPSGERGVALLVTLLVVALLTIIVIEFTYSTEVDAHLTRNALSALQARYLARSAVALAEITLKKDSEEKAKGGAKIETLSDSWAQPFPPMPVGDAFGTVAFTIVDEARRFNLNALSLAASPQLEMRKTLFQGILSAVGLDTNLIFPLLDWLDPDDETQSEKGAESQYYLGLSPPYVPRNGRLLTLEELAMVKGFDQLTVEQWIGLRLMVTVIANNNNLAINVNTAPEVLLTALFAAIDNEGLGHTIAKQREEQPFDDAKLGEFLKAYQADAIRGAFTARSQTFTIHARGAAGDVERGLAVTEQFRGVFPPRLDVLEWREEAGVFTLTSPEPSGGMSSIAP